MSIFSKFVERLSGKRIEGEPPRQLVPREMTPLERVAQRNNRTAVIFYEAMRSSPSEKIDLVGRTYGVLGDWIWVSRLQPSEKELILLSLKNNAEAVDTNTFDLLVHFDDFRYEIYRLNFKNGELQFRLDSAINRLVDEEKFLSSLFYPLRNTDLRRAHPDPATEPPNPA